jgi:pimeloyl-ACP methyl ester carboxylesterase
VSANDPDSNLTPPERLELRIHGHAGGPTLVYLPGLHGDWTLVSSFRAALAGRAQFAEFTYPRTLTWSLEEYADAVEAALLEQGVDSGWLLGESFGSQLVWPLCAEPRSFRPLGVILAGGFVRHPGVWGVRGVACLIERMSTPTLRRYLVLYAWYARFRHRHARETLATLPEFLDRRTELDRQAVVHRLHLIAGSDYRPVARRLRLPVYYLAGLVDPIVWWGWERLWLHRHCPGYRGGRTLGLADHNVLSTAPGAAADQVFHWIGLP